VNKSLFAIPLGLCGLTPEIAFNIEKLERIGLRLIRVYIDHPKKDLYLLPDRYTNMVSNSDIEQINTGLKNIN